jgi:general secretion pathway protein A
MVLLGQPELRDLLDRPELRQLAQRITARFHLTPLDADEVEAYVRHRVAVAGATRFPFTRLAVKRLHHHAGGVPRLVNVIAERALLAGYARDEHPVGERLVDLAAREVLVRPLKRLPKPSTPVVVGAALALGIALFALAPQRTLTPPTPTLSAGLAMPIPPPRLDAATLAARLRQLDGALAPAAGELMRMWAVRAQEATAARLGDCAPVLAPGLLCQTGTTSLDALVALQRPALVQLQGAEGRRVWAVLLGADALRVRLWLGDIAVDVARVDFNRHFRGRHLSLWRGPQVLAGLPAEGDTGPDVDWLASRLAAQRQMPVPYGPAEFDAALAAALREVQRVHGLDVDGVPGPATLRALGAERSDGPRLRRALD